MYETGQGVEQDDEEAIEWYEKSAKQKNKLALEKLEDLLEDRKLEKEQESTNLAIQKDSNSQIQSLKNIEHLDKVIENITHVVTDAESFEAEEEFEEIEHEGVDRELPQAKELIYLDESDTTFSSEDEELDHDCETIGESNSLEGNANEQRDEGKNKHSPLGRKTQLPSNAIFLYLIDSLSSMPGMSASQELNIINLLLHQREAQDLRITLEIKRGCLVTESLFPFDESMMKPLLEITGSAGFSCRFGIERKKYVLRRNFEITNMSPDDVYQNILEIVSDAKLINDVLLEG